MSVIPAKMCQLGTIVGQKGSAFGCRKSLDIKSLPFQMACSSRV